MKVTCRVCGKSAILKSGNNFFPCSHLVPDNQLTSVGSYIIQHLNKYIEGQDKVKEMLAAALVKHSLKTNKNMYRVQEMYCKSNALILGPTGCGKSYMMKVLKEIINVPIIEVNGGDLAIKGWSGECLGDIILRETSRYSAGVINHSIVFIDEIDKACVPRIGAGGTDYNKALQQSILKTIEGQAIGKDCYDIPIETNNMLFIFGGNFQELRENLNNTKPSIGFMDQTEEKIDLSEIHQELIHTGMIPELAGRISMMAEVKPLTKEQMYNILLNPNSGPLYEYNKLLEWNGLPTIVFTNAQMESIINTCMKKDVGVRGLTSAVDKHMKKYLKDLRYLDAFNFIKAPDKNLVKPSRS